MLLVAALEVTGCVTFVKVNPSTIVQAFSPWPMLAPTQMGHR